MTSIAIKAIAFVCWPFIALFLLLLMSIAFVGCWIAIPFGRFDEKDGKLTLRVGSKEPTE